MSSWHWTILLWKQDRYNSGRCLLCQQTLAEKMKACLATPTWTLMLQPGVKPRPLEHTFQIYQDCQDTCGLFLSSPYFCSASKLGCNCAFIMLDSLPFAFQHLSSFLLWVQPKSTVNYSIISWGKVMCCKCVDGSGVSVTLQINLLHSRSWTIIAPNLKALLSNASLRST